LFVADPTRQSWQEHPDLCFFREGGVQRGFWGGGLVDDLPVDPGVPLEWSPSGELCLFTPARTVTVSGVPCLGGETVSRNGRAFFFTPAADIPYRGFPCRAGHKVDDYGPGLGLHFTSAAPFAVGGRTVPAGVRVTIMDDGGARFALTAPTDLDGRMLAAGTSVWLTGAGEIREIAEPHGEPRR
jgi:hypothetical protein